MDNVTFTVGWAADDNLYSALITHEQLGFLSMPHTLLPRTSIYMVSSEDPWHLYLLSIYNIFETLFQIDIHVYCICHLILYIHILRQYIFFRFFP